MNRHIVRKPSLKKSIAASTTGKYKRTIKRKLIPGYGKKGTGIYKDPAKHFYNKAYSHSSIDSRKIINKSSSTKKDENSGCGCYTTIIILIILAYIGQKLFGDTGATIFTVVGLVIIGFVDIVSWIG